MDEKIYEINIKRFIQSTEYQLKKLAECCAKIHEFQTYQDWRNVKQAQQNASQIIKRIRSDIKQILQIRSQIVAHLVANHNKPTSLIVTQIDDQLRGISRRVESQAKEIDNIHAPYYSYELKNHDAMLQAGCVAPDPFMFQMKMNETLAKEKDLCEAYQQLQKDCEDLQVIMQHFSEEIFAQKSSVDSIERNVTEAHSNVEAGAVSLKQALNFKILHTAAGGAFVGTCLGGPVGLMAGAKIGALFGLGSGCMAYFVAKRLGKQPEPE